MRVDILAVDEVRNTQGDHLVHIISTPREYLLRLQEALLVQEMMTFLRTIYVHSLMISAALFLLIPQLHACVVFVATQDHDNILEREEAVYFHHLLNN